MTESPYLRAEFLLILEALEQGIVPGDEAARELIEMGLLERGANGPRMTVQARVKLENLRAQASAGNLASP
jgi:hypothetical protein